MVSYFPLLPSITIPDCEEKIYGSLTFLNHPNNLKKANKFKNNSKTIFLGTYKFSKSVWELISIQKCNYGEFCDLNRNSINALSDEMVVSLVRYDDHFPENSIILPKPESLRIDQAPVAERSSLNFHFRNSSTTYQGEYPFGMSNLKNASFWSFDTLKEKLKNNKEIESFLILMNITRDSSLQSEVNIEIYNPNEKAKKINMKTSQNRFKIVNLRELTKNFEGISAEESLFIQCNKISFIPMILSVNVKTSQLSLEHTHPPTEMFWGREKFGTVKLIKERWL